MYRECICQGRGTDSSNMLVIIAQLIAQIRKGWCLWHMCSSSTYTYANIHTWYQVVMETVIMELSITYSSKFKFILIFSHFLWNCMFQLLNSLQFWNLRTFSFKIVMKSNQNFTWRCPKFHILSLALRSSTQLEVLA